MKEVTIKYKDARVLELLKTLAKLLGFSVAHTKKTKAQRDDYTYINGIPVLPGNNSIEINELGKIFTGKNLHAEKLRTGGWRRQK